MHEFYTQRKAPNRNTVIDVILSPLYEREKCGLITTLEEVPYVAIMSDGWTSVAQDHHPAFTVLYITNWELKGTLFVPRIEVNVTVEKTDVPQEYGITEMVKVITVDNAANMTVAADKANITKCLPGSYLELSCTEEGNWVSWGEHLLAVNQDHCGMV